MAKVPSTKQSEKLRKLTEGPKKKEGDWFPSRKFQPYFYRLRFFFGLFFGFLEVLGYVFEYLGTFGLRFCMFPGFRSIFLSILLEIAARNLVRSEDQRWRLSTKPSEKLRKLTEGPKKKGGRLVFFPAQSRKENQSPSLCQTQPGEWLAPLASEYSFFVSDSFAFYFCFFPFSFLFFSVFLFFHFFYMLCLFSFFRFIFSVFVVLPIQR